MDTRNVEERMNELKTLCEPVREWLEKEYHPLAQIVIDHERVRVVEDGMSVPFT